MPIDEVIEAVTIQLPKPLDLKKAEDLLAYIAREMPADIHYTINSHVNLLPESAKKVLRDQGSFQISGTIVSLNSGNRSAFDTFETAADIKDYNKISAIRFSIIPGYDELDDYLYITKQLWGHTKLIVSEYFKKK